MIIDSHVHVFPDPVGQHAPDAVKGPLSELRKRARAWLKPVTGPMHKAQTVFRHLPEPLRTRLDELSGLLPLPALLVESTVNDLLEGMDDSGIDYAVVIAHPPFISNELVLEAHERDNRLLPVVNIPSGTPRPGYALRKYVEAGAIALKIHPAADGEGADSPRYKALLKVADELGLPVIIHTGCLHSHLLYKDPEQGHAQRFTPWFDTYKNIRFVLAHMNFHEPNVALDLAEEYPNIYMDTSWQPAEVIGEAVRRVGAERVMFGTDWPFVGNNLNVGLNRVRDCIQAGTLSEEQSRLILGENALKILGIAERCRSSSHASLPPSS